MFSFIEKLAAFAQGKGAGSGWDLRSEVRVAARILRARRYDAPPVIIDAGAHNGLWTRLLLDELRDASPQPVLHLFEPSPHNAGALSGQTWPEGGAVHIHEAALGCADGTATLHEPTPGSLLSALHPRTDSFLADAGGSQTPVRIVALDSWAKGNAISRIDYLKLDIEGHELDALHGASELLQSGRICALTFEFGSANVATRTFFRDFWDYLRPLGFQFSRIAPGGFLIPVHAYSETHEYFRGATNYLCNMIRS